MARILNGKEVSETVRKRVAEEIRQLKSSGTEPSLAVIIVGDDPASRIYVNNKKKACADLGITSYEYTMARETTEKELIELIARLNADCKVSGILCQLPLPPHISEQAVISAINPLKDVDAFNAENTGRIMSGSPRFLPCTPAGIVEILKHNNVQMSGKNCVIIGRSNIVGKPMSMLMLSENATVTVCHSKTQNLSFHTLAADILISAVGKAKFVTGEMIKEGAAVVDVGMNRDENGILCGDVDFDAAALRAGMITPVPGGVGPMTITMLMQNTVTAARLQNCDK